MDDSIGIYFHIPFCKAKCYYCDFNSYSGREHLAGSYFSALKDEIISRSAVLRNRLVRTVFIGGGTPSLVDPAHIKGLLEVCSRHLNIADNAEISMESNPGTLDYEKLKQYRKMGINRLSIGLQAWQDGLLKSIGRIHDRQQYIDNFNAAVDAGFDNINVDLIFGLPGQTFDDWAETLEAVTEAGRSGGTEESGVAGESAEYREPKAVEESLEYGELRQARESAEYGEPRQETESAKYREPRQERESAKYRELRQERESVKYREPRQIRRRFLKHISCYSLKIEEGTVLGDKLEAGKLVPVDDELDRLMYHYAVEFLAKKGYRQYEISNFAYPGYECRHNLIYWKAMEYAGFGAGAHSFLDSVRFNNVPGIEQYIMAVKCMINRTGYDRSVPGTGRDEPASDRSGAAENMSKTVGGQNRTEGNRNCLVENLDWTADSQGREPDNQGSEADSQPDSWTGRDTLIELFEDKQRISKTEAMAEFMILGLRLTDGVNSVEFEERFNESLEAVYGDKLDRLVRKGLVSVERKHISKDFITYKLTKLGLDLANSVFIEFI